MKEKIYRLIILLLSFIIVIILVSFSIIIKDKNMIINGYKSDRDICRKKIELLKRGIYEDE